MTPFRQARYKACGLGIISVPTTLLETATEGFLFILDYTQIHRTAIVPLIVGKEILPDVQDDVEISHVLRLFLVAIPDCFLMVAVDRDGGIRCNLGESANPVLKMNGIGVAAWIHYGLHAFELVDRLAYQRSNGLGLVDSLLRSFGQSRASNVVRICGRQIRNLRGIVVEGEGIIVDAAGRVERHSVIWLVAIDIRWFAHC